MISFLFNITLNRLFTFELRFAANLQKRRTDFLILRSQKDAVPHSFQFSKVNSLVCETS